MADESAFSRASGVKTDSEAIAVLGELAELREWVRQEATDATAPLQRQSDELERQMDEIWQQARQVQDRIEREIKRLGALVAGTKPTPKHPMPRNKPVSEGEVLEVFRRSNVLRRPSEVAEALGIESTSAFRRMLRSMAEQGLINQSGERGGSRYYPK